MTHQNQKGAMVGAISFAILSVLMLGLHTSGMLVSLDQAAFEWVAAVRSELLTSFLSALTFLGGGTALAPLGLIVIVICFYKGYRQEALAVFLTLLTIFLLNEGMKAYFARPRPALFHLIEVPASFSFPSGHAMVGTAFYLLLAVILRNGFREKIWSWIIQPAAFLLVALVAASRVYLGVHYVSDVICGFCLSMIFYFLARFALAKWSDRHREMSATLESVR